MTDIAEAIYRNRPIVNVNVTVTSGIPQDDPIPEGEDVGDDPVREPISEDDPRVGHEPVEE